MRNLGCGNKKCMKEHRKKQKDIWREGSVVKLGTFSLEKDSLEA